MNKKYIFCLLCLTSFLLSNKSFQMEEKNYTYKLSDYGFFEGKLAEMKTAKDVFKYEINAPLFSDYAHKARFIRLPAGEKVNYQAERVFDFPIGTAIIKTFFYYKDERKTDSPRQIMETRVLLHEENGWIALPYIWNEEQTDAFLEVAGGNIDIKWKDAQGKKQELNYKVPNMVQCKGCHSYDKEMTPIGPSARQLHLGDQLSTWSKKDYINDLPNLSEISALARWQHPESGTLEERARAYLDGNCGHCHHPKGPASTSGMFLTTYFNDPTTLGINKAPIAAGRGAGGRPFSIVPGQPNQSIMLYRLESTDPGEMMPEVGRQMRHKEGTDLIRAWIKSMKE